MELISTNHSLQVAGQTLPAVFATNGDAGTERFFEYFAATIRNPRTREVYLRAALRFGRWCDGRGLALAALRPLTSRRTSSSSAKFSPSRR